jgi:2-C-methyl-D-erythritol 2,4-cyclodiphosphate synthase
MRIGFGYDSHAFDPGRELILGGVKVPDAPGLRGHSDGDAVAHAVTDALLGAAALGDIGSHFPPDDPQWENADSMKLLEHAVSLVADSGFRVGNVDITVICEHPKVGPLAGRIRRSLGSVLGTAPSEVSIKGKTNEGMGWEGRREGLAVHAVALLLSR